MADLLERLRKRADDKFIRDYPLMAEAADEIERLRDYETRFWATVAEVERLRLQWTGMKSEVQVCRENTERLRKAATDALAGWVYIRRTHGDLDRVQSALVAVLNVSECAEPKEPPPSPDIRGTSGSTCVGGVQVTSEPCPVCGATEDDVCRRAQHPAAHG